MRPLRSSGRADPFGLLVLGVALALFVTIGVQVQASIQAEPERIRPVACVEDCLAAYMPH